jgi:hypothetical protein
VNGLPERGDHHVTTSLGEVRGEFDYVLVGGGGTAAAFIDAVLERSPDARILVLEQGTFLLPTHAQNLGRAYQPLMASAAVAPWTSDGDLEIVAQVPYLGGRTLMWSGSCPQPTADQLSRWPSEVVRDLEEHWDAAREWVGARPVTELGAEYGGLHRAMRHVAAQVAAREGSLLEPESERDLDAPLAFTRHETGQLQKFAAIVPLLRAAVDNAGVTIVSDSPVHSLRMDGSAVTGIRTRDGVVPVGRARVVLTCGSTEATGIVLRSRPDLVAPLAGRNLAANAASFFTCRLPRDAFPELSARLPELAALYVDGATASREFHLHVSAVATADPDRDRDRVYHLMPDMFGDGTPSRVCDEDHVVLVMHGLSEVAGHGTRSSASTVRLEDDALVGTFRLDAEDEAAWAAMDSAADAVLVELAGDAAIEYWEPSTGAWQEHPPARRMPFAFHESGTLWMGADPLTSVSDLHGRVHGTDDLYVLGGATFPTRGSWNPYLTMVALARRLASVLAGDAPDSDGATGAPGHGG